MVVQFMTDRTGLCWTVCTHVPHFVGLSMTQKGIFGLTSSICPMHTSRCCIVMLTESVVHAAQDERSCADITLTEIDGPCTFGSELNQLPAQCSRHQGHVL